MTSVLPYSSNPGQNTLPGCRNNARLTSPTSPDDHSGRTTSISPRTFFPISSLNLSQAGTLPRKAQARCRTTHFRLLRPACARTCSEIRDCRTWIIGAASRRDNSAACTLNTAEIVETVAHGKRLVDVGTAHRTAQKLLQLPPGPGKQCTVVFRKRRRQPRK